MHHISWSESVWFSDIDDTLINTAQTTFEASEGIKLVFSSRFGERVGKKIQANFNDIFRTMVAGLRNKTDADWFRSGVDKEDYERVLSAIETYQREMKQQFGSIRKFSREVFIKLSADTEGLDTAPETIYEAADAYWVTLSERVQVMPGVLDLVREIKNHRRPLYLLTGSDARLKIKPNGQFAYMPQESEDFKRERVSLLRGKGINFNVVSIGDPEDKPHLDFFTKGVKAAENDLGQPINLSNAIVMGDSYAADLQTPIEKMGFGLGVLFEHGKEGITLDSEHQITTGFLADAVHYVSE